MGLNLNSSLMMERAGERFATHFPQSITVESYYTSSLEAITEMNQELCNITSGLFTEMNYLVSEESCLTEGNIVSTVIQKINEVFAFIIKQIKKFKDMIMKAIKSVIIKIKTAKLKEYGDPKNQKIIASIYKPDVYFSMNKYSENLQPALLDPNDPPTDVMVNSREIDAALLFLNTMFHTGMTDEEFEYNTEQNEKQNEEHRLSMRKRLCGAGSNVVDTDVMNTANFIEYLKHHFLGEKSNQTVTVEDALQANENLLVLHEVYASFEKTYNDIQKSYAVLEKRIETFRNQGLKYMREPDTNYKYDADSTKENLRDYEERMYAIGKTAADLAASVNGMLQDHLLAYMQKTDAILSMMNQDMTIMKMIIGLSKKNESSMINVSDKYFDEQNFMEDYENYIMECFMIDEAYAKEELQRSLHSLILEAEDSSGGKKNVILRIIDSIVSMFKKFFDNVTILARNDVKWLQQNEKTIKNVEFKFPAQNENMEEWVVYDTDKFTKSLDIPAFDTSNGELMTALESDESYATYLLRKMGSANAGGGDGDFSSKCKAVYTNGEEISIKISQLQNDKDKMYDFCMNYVSGENGGIYKSLKKDSESLDKSKKLVMRALDQLAATNTAARQDKPQDTSDKDDSNKPSQGTPTAPENNSGAEDKQNEATLLGLNINLAELLGIQEGHTVLSEIAPPKVSDADKEAAKKNIEAGADGTKESVDELVKKATRFFRMTGNALGAKMSTSMACYKQYMSMFKWALKATDNRPKENVDTVNTKETTDDSGESIMDAAKKD